MERLKKSILVVANSRFWNAEMHYAFNLALGLQQRGHDVFFIAQPNSITAAKVSKAKIRLINDIDLDSSNPIKLIFAIFRIRNHIRLGKIEVINSFKSNGAIVLAIVKLLNRKLLWIRTRGVNNKPKNNWGNRKLYCSIPDGLIFASNKTKNWFSSLNPKLPTRVIYYGSPAVKANINRDTAKIKLGIDPKQLTFGLLGRSQLIKGQLEAIEAFKDTQKNSVLLLFIKDLAEYPENNLLIKQKIANLQLKLKVKIMGHQADLGSSLMACDCAVIPSLSSEINCRSFVEFSSLKIPAIAFPTGSLSEIIVDNKNGLLCTEPSIDELARRISEVESNPIILERLGNQAYQDWCRFYTQDALTENFLNFIHEIEN